MHNIVADWDSIDRVIIPTLTQAFETLGRAFNFLLNAQKPDRKFQNLSVSKIWKSVSKARLLVLKQILDRVFRTMDTLRIFDNLVCKK